MKKQLLLSAILLSIVTGITSSVSIAQPYADDNEACWYRACGKGIPYADVPEKTKIWKPGLDFTCWNGDMSCNNKYAIGSQNHPVMAAMSWGDYHWMAELARYEKGHGVFGRELGAPAYYFANVVACKIMALRDARAAGNYQDAKDLAEDLRCIWAYDALVAAATPRKNCWINLHGQIYTNAGDAAGYDGLTVAAAGDRWHTEDNITSDSHGKYLAWALDWQGRSESPSKNLITSKGKWWEENTAQCTNVPYYNQTTDPLIFGLTAAERQKLVDCVNGDVNAAKWAAQVVASYGTWKDPGVFQLVPDCYHKIRMRKTSLGAEIIYFNATNGNKPCQSATQIFNNGDYKSIRPNFYHGTGANNGYTCWVANGLIQADAPGDGAYVSMPEMGGTILWQVDIDGHDIVFNGTKLTAAAAPNYPMGPDVGVTAFISPAATFSATSVTPKVTVKNFSSATVDNVYVSYQLNNGPMWTTTWSGSLAPNATVNVTLWNAPVTNGNYTLKAYTGGPNHLQDSNTANDSKSMSFTVGSGGPAQTLDAGVNAIVDPTSTLMDDSIQPVGKIQNFGTTVLTSTSISYKLNNGTPVTKSWSGNLAAGASTNYTFPKVPIAPGTYTIQVYTTNPNGGTDGNAGNDDQTLVFNVVSPHVTDVEVVSVGEPLNLGCNTVVAPLIVIKNNGPEILDQVTLNFQVDAGAVVSKTYSVAPGTGLKVDSAMGLRANTTTVTVGAHSLKMWSSQPNTAPDVDNTNDTLVSTFTVTATAQALPFSENFENVIPGEIPSTWTRYNSDAFEDWFVYGYGSPSNKAAAFNNYAYTGAKSKKDNLTLPPLNLTGSSTAWLTFDLSHASRPAPTTYDSLEIRISVDCGATYTHVWGLGGTALNTTFDDSTIFIPTGWQDYKNFNVDLSAYTTSNNAIIRFVNWSNNGNSTLVDNVNVTSSVTGVAENNSTVVLNVFPVPVKDMLTVEFSLHQSSALTLQLINTLGQSVYSESIATHDAGIFSTGVDISRFSAGVYQLVVSSSNGISQKKILIAK